ncbi:MAG: polysaccharide deacetylase family protein [Nocardioidaceae bacterium]
MTNTGRGPLLTRRLVLLSVAGVVIGTGAMRIDAKASTPTGVLHPGDGPTEDAPGGRLASASFDAKPLRVGTQTVTTPTGATPTGTSPTVSTRIPAWAKSWHAPVYDLDDFLRREPHARFPHRSVLLTIDDGPSPEWTPRYLRLLAKHDIKATFNMIGEQVLPYRKIVHALASEGHTVSNHTWTHDERLPFRRPRDIRREIAHTNEVIHEVTGVRPNQFRAPGGVWGPRVYRELARQQMMPVDWNIDPRDWARPGTPEIEAAMLRARHGDIILCHDGGGDRSETYRALQVVLPELKHRGLRFVTLP